jgi:hypothetical protein
MTLEDFNKLYSFSVNSDLKRFEEIFDGPENGRHMWDKFTKDYKRNFMEFFYHGVDENNKAKIFNFIYNK